MENNGIDSKVLEMACKDYLLAAVTNSESLREKLTFTEQVKLAEHVMTMGYNDVVSVLFYEGEQITNEQIKDFENRTKRRLKYGAAFVAGGGAGRYLHNKYVQKPYEFAKDAAKQGVKVTNLTKGAKVAKKVLGSPLRPGKLGNLVGPGGRGALIGVGLLYLYRKLMDPCVRKSLTIKNVSQRKLVKHQCQAAACKKVIGSISSDKSRCSAAPNPEKCRKRLEKETMKWRKRYQKELIEIAKIKSDKGKNG